MHMLLSLAGLAATLAGAAALGYGFVSPAFRSDAIVMAAVLGLAGGLILVALAAIVRQLRRIADAIEMQPMANSLATISEPRPSVAAISEPRNAEAGAAGASAVAAALALGPEPPAAPAPSEAAPEVIAVEPPPLEPAAEAKRPAVPPVRSPAIPSESLRGSERLPAASPLPSKATSGTEWPHVDASDRVAPPRDMPSSGRDTAPRVVAEPPLASKPSATVVLERSAPPVEAPAPDKPRVLKSGVIEGMAYTLYSDGSVNAELPTGTTHFPSISAWRAHLREGA